MQKVILHIPHSSNIIPFYDGYVATDAEIKDEILKLTDWHTEDLFIHKLAIPVIAPFSRIFCDVERFSDDKEEEMAKYGMGMLYETLDNGKKLREIDEKLRAKIYKNYYKPHHAQLTNFVDEQLRKEGKALIIDCHSFSNIPFNRDLNKSVPRPQICIGADEFHTSQSLVHLIKEYFQNNNYICEINNPYNGSLVPSNYYNENKNVQSVMIEINRNLYLKDSSNERNENYNNLKKTIYGLINHLL